ncbi:DNA topoisomerase IV subunit A [Sporosarcina sp. Marseille-Q4063]|uniref:DNA topoisomerase IV subunit A n=1 Tax=Sporosarcina sp. Marseille-Q4063 TaxID=2810514 RepID=UPI001BAFFAD7|nr:DNA topoisomerase IV subunit A [Sporosarcina sp. Marseille-Q4063]QUW22347.1 DNA topoisomerase IV subunit A [Sporosarcina sp. Marseille-Q4063]
MTNVERFQDLPLEEVVGDRFGRYSKYIIQDRALPDARDGLKPVQRRILYAMFHEGNTHEKAFRKAAKTVGNVIGNYHPHGDSSVYEAMVRMSQDWKLRHMMIEMHGNNGSIDGDSAAAMRYTEARLSGIAGEMLRDIGKNTVDFIPNFDDTEPEPTVLPARFPNLLVNGSTGISAGYATDIPPHALHEVLDAVLLRLENPEVTVEELMTVIKGPDFPTGGIIQGTDGIKTAYKTGKGRFVIRAKTSIEQLRGGKSQIVVTEIPYDVNKANMVKRMDELRIDRKLDGIADVRDESDRTGLRIVIELKKDTDSNGILQYLLKNTDLQVTYNFNMIAISGRRPTLMSLPMLLDAYIDHQKEVVTRRSQFDIQKAKDRLHIVEGLMKALSVLDEVIKTIRESKDKRDAKNNIIAKFDFSEVQAEAIVSLQLYRLTNTDITELQREDAELRKLIDKLDAILKSDKKLSSVIKKELSAIRKQFAEPRRSDIEEKIEEIKVDIDILIPSEEVHVSVTKDGYIKRTSVRSYSASNGTGHDMKESDYMLFESPMNTQHHLLLFTSFGNYLYQPVHELPDIRWRDLGQHISSIIPLEQNETIIAVIGLENFEEEANIITVSKNGMIKQSSVASFEVRRYNRTFRAMGVRKGDEMVDARLVKGDEDVILFTKQAFALRFPLAELSVTGVRTAGVRGINLRDDDQLVSLVAVREEENASLVLATQRGAAKRMNLREFETAKRAQRGVVVLRVLQSNPHEVIGVEMATNDEIIVLATDKDHKIPILAGSLRLVDRYSNGSFIADEKKDGRVTHIYKDPKAELE